MKEEEEEERGKGESERERERTHIKRRDGSRGDDDGAELFEDGRHR